MLTNAHWSPDTLTFTLCGADPGTAKRIQNMIKDIPTLAIDSVHISVCEEPNEELIAHSLGLVPVTFHFGTVMPADFFKRVSECGCQGTRCPACSVLFTCDVKEDRPVYSHDFKSTQNAILMRDIEICRGPFVAIAYASLGSGHVKYQCSAPIPYYKHPIHVQLNPDRKLTDIQKRKLVDVCPAKVFRLEGDIEDLSVDPTKRCILCEECVKKGIHFREDGEEGEEDLVHIEVENTTFNFIVECVGQIRPNLIMDYVYKNYKF